MLDTITTPAEADQALLEEAAMAEGARRYHQDQEARASREGFERRDNVAKMIRGAIPILSEAIGNWVAAAGAAKGRKSAGYAAISQLDPDVCAYVGLSQTFRRVAKGGSLTEITISIGRTIEIELEALAIDETDEKAARRFKAGARGAQKTAMLAQRHQRLADDLGVSLGWDDRQRMLTGDIILGLILTSLPDLFVRGTQTSPKGFQVPVVEMTDGAAQALNEMAETVAWLRPALQPMLTVPRPWTDLFTGCYNDPRLAKAVPLVRTYSSEHKRLLKEALDGGEMGRVLQAVNAMQETRFAIDDRVLGVIFWAREQGLKVSKSFPTASANLPPLPAKANDVEWALMSPERRSAMSRNRKAIRNLRTSAGVEGGVFNADTDIAAYLNEFEAFYLPHSLDFRGRTYAVPAFNHQRSDHMKAMFRFADGVALGPAGGDWLMIHLANCGDEGKVSKEPFAARIQWVRDNHDRIMRCAEDPAGAYGDWSEMDSPFCFLQACFEYGEWAYSGFSPDFLSTIAVAADGSCSGLQHYSAITRAENEAFHVNLLPRPDVGDIYKVVAARGLETLTAKAHECPYADRILSLGFGRSDVKRNVMTYFYGSERFGMRDQHMEDKMRPLADQVAMGTLQAHPYQFLVQKEDKATGEITERLDGGFSCAQVLATHTYSAVVTVAPKANEAAKWIQAVAAILAHESQSMVWSTPSGMPVVQRYSEYTSKQINLWLYDRAVLVPKNDDKLDTDGNVLSRVRLLIREAPTKRVNKKRMRSASSPNVIHSMDAAHLHLSVVAAAAEGIRHFMMIHDSFGTHAGNMATFARIIRQALVDMYSDYCPMEMIAICARVVLSEEGAEKLPPVPAKGSLDLSQVLQSAYAFA